MRPSATRAAVRSAQVQQRQRYAARRQWWRGPIPIIGTVVIVGLIVVLFIMLGTRGGTETLTPAPANVVQAVTQVSPTVGSTVGTGGLPNPLHATSANMPILKDSGGKPVVLYIGANFCPFCAAQRWSIIVALSRFGTFSNLHLTTSAANDSFPNTNTFTFYKSTYTSPYIDFQSVETNTNQPNGLGGYTSLESLTDAQQKLLDTYDAPPYTPQQQAGGIPFLTIGNQYIALSSGFSPQVLQGQSWQEISSALSNPQSLMTQYIVGNANYLTAAICSTTNNQPANVCSAPTITQIQAQLAKLPKGQ
jgi:hypothetical protein